MSKRLNGSKVQTAATPGKRRSARYTPETRERAVALVLGGVKREKILREIGCTGESLTQAVAQKGQGEAGQNCHEHGPGRHRRGQRGGCSPGAGDGADTGADIGPRHGDGAE